MNYYDNESNRKQFVSHLMKFDKDQLMEINIGNLIGLSADQICVYARPEFSYLVMRLIKDCFIEQMYHNKIKFIANPGFAYFQMVQIKNGFDKGLSLDQMKECADTTMTYNQISKNINRALSE